MAEERGRGAAARRASGAATGGLLFALAQPPWGAWPLAFVCLLPLLWACRGASPAARLGCGAIAGAVATLIGCVDQGAVATAGFFEVPIWQAGLASLAAAQIYGSLSFALFALLVGGGSPGPFVAAARTGLAMVTAEALRCVVAGGLPWLLLAYAVAPVPELLSAARWGGVLLVSGLLAALQGGAGAARPGVRLRAGVLVGVALLALTAPGLLDRSVASGALRVRVLHVDPNEDGPKATVRSAIRSLLAASQGEPVDLIVWPENAVPALLPANEALVRDALGEGALPAPVLLGATRATSTRPALRLTSALLVSPRGTPLGYYDKRRPVPFFERMPAPFPRPEGFVGVTPGAGSPVLASPGAVLGPMLCYEGLFPDLARESVRAGATLLVHLSNESWFGDTGAREQLLAAAAFRAVETGRSVIRSTQAGVTAVIDPRGRVTRAGPGDDVLEAVIELRDGLTPSVRWGTAWWAVAALLSLLAWIRDAWGQAQEPADTAALREIPH